MPKNMDKLEDGAITTSLRQVFEWAKMRDFKGHDPHDLLESPIFSWLTKLGNFPGAKLLRLAVVQAGRRSPLNLHKVLLSPFQQNPKAIALFISGLTRARESVTDDWLEVAKSLARRLQAHNQGTNRAGWGYPFAWQSRTHFLERHAPTIVSTAFVGEALLDLYELTSDPSLLESVSGAVNYILQDVSKTQTEFGVAFGYAENDPQIVFNASLLGAALLARFGALTENPKMIAIAKSAAEFVVHYQRPDGSWVYGLERPHTWIDSFHTGYVLCSLSRIAAITEDEALSESAVRGFLYFRNNFFLGDGTPKYYHDRTYPIDAHAAAQAIITLIAFDDTDFAGRVTAWALKNLYAPRGYFYYQVHRRSINRVPYMRWSNAWMFRALAEIVGKKAR